MRKKKYSVIIPSEVYPKLLQREISAAYILADYFQADVKFVPRSGFSTPDFLIKSEYWELKTPTGTGKYNIQHALRSAVQQSDKIIIDARFSKQNIARIKNELNFQFRNSKNIKKLLLVDKQKNVLVISGK